MPTLNLDIDYFEHPKTLRLSDVLASDPQAVLYPIRLWCHCAKFRKKGWIPLAYQAEIERACKWTGEPGRLITTFVKEHWIHRAGPGWQVKDWLEREGHIPAFSERAKQAAKARWNHKNIGDATSIRKHMLGDATSNAPAVQCSTVPAVQQEEREKEALRAYKKRESPPARPSARPPPVFEGLPIFQEDGSLVAHWLELGTAWRQAYPGVDVIQELQSAHSWLVANPTRQKKSNSRFLRNWMDRAYRALKGQRYDRDAGTNHRKRPDRVLASGVS